MKNIYDDKNFLVNTRKCHAVNKAYPEQVNGISSSLCFLN